MRWLSRRVQGESVPRITITVMQPSCARTPRLSGFAGTQSTAWDNAFELLDALSLPATWATVIGPDRPALGTQLVASQVPHELAFHARNADLAKLLSAFKKQQLLIRRASVPLRTLLSDSAGVHPSVLAGLGVQAVVPVGRVANLSRTGSPRAMAWQQWELPPTLRLRADQLSTDSLALTAQLRLLQQQSGRLHLLWEPTVDANQAAQARIAEALNHIANLNRRGWVQVETSGAAADNASLRSAA